MRRWRLSLKASVVPLVLLIISLVYGWITLSGSPQGERMKIALVPGNIRQMDKLMAWRRDGARRIFNKYARITEIAAAEEPDLIVWPETSVPQYTFVTGSVPNGLSSLVQKWNAYLLIGTPHAEYLPERRTYNAAFLLSPEGEEIDRYYKIHLVPVSEYFPMKRYLPESWQKLITGVSDWDSGSEQTIFSAPPAEFGVVICFESIFPKLFRQAVGEGVNLMGIITNDAWFEGTFAPEQHYSIAPFRAAENRISVFRCANHGISCIIDPWGRISQKTEPKSDEEYLVGEVWLHRGGTFYTRHGDYLPWACLTAALILAFYTWWYMKDR
jgi:apolipoprotein N-acyltransferase